MNVTAISDTAAMLVPGRRLLTQDGRKIGNAIIIAAAEIKSPGYPPCWRIRTDFGNGAILTAREIDDWFYVGDIVDLDLWLQQRNRGSA